MTNEKKFKLIRSQIVENEDNQPQQEKEDHYISTEFGLVKALLDNYMNPKLLSAAKLVDLNIVLNLQMKENELFSDIVRLAMMLEQR